VHISVLRVEMLCSSVNRYKHFRGWCCPQPSILKMEVTHTSKTLVTISTRVHVKSEMTLIHLVTDVERLKVLLSFTVEISVLSDVKVKVK